MNNVITVNLLRFFGLVLLQGLVFKNIGTGWVDFPYLHIVLFPLFILLLPLRTPTPLLIFLGFVAGIFVDFLYNTMGLHASAAVFTAFVRPFILRLLEPRGGYNTPNGLTAKRMGIGWFFRYAAVMMAIHLFFYFSVEAFTFVYIGSILAKTAVSFVVSMIFVAIYQLLFNPVD